MMSKQERRRRRVKKLCATSGVPFALAMLRIHNNKWSVLKAATTPVGYRPETLAKRARDFGIKYSTVIARKQRGITGDALFAPVADSGPWPDTRRARESGLHPDTVYKRKKRGITGDAVFGPVEPRSLAPHMPFVYAGQLTGLNPNTVIKRFQKMQGNFDLVTLLAPAQRTQPDPNSYRQRCLAAGIKLSTFYRRRRHGMSVDEAIAKGPGRGTV